MIKRKQFAKVAGAICCVVAFTSALSGCKVDERYNFENIKNVNTDVTIFQNGISVPLVQSTAKISVDSLINLSGLDTTAFGDYLKVYDNGDYYLGYETNYSMKEALDERTSRIWSIYLPSAILPNSPTTSVLWTHLTSLPRVWNTKVVKPSATSTSTLM